MSSKKWYRSRGIWLGILTFLVSGVEIAKELIQNGDFSSLAMLTAVTGLLKVGERMTSSNTDIVA